LRVTRAERETVLEPFENIFRVVDYGALTERAASTLRAKGIPVVQKPMADWQGGEGKLPLYPSADFVERLLWLAENSSLRRRLTESLMLSVIVATKRVAGRGGSSPQPSINRQFLEYRRMRAETALSLSKALAYEARVNNQYWSVYKTMLKASGLGFKSRVRDRFVREFVNSIRGRARGYSHANAGINYLHQRRLLRCRMVNARAGIGWVGCEGILHIASRRPSVGLLLDLSDPFKLADRERFLDMSLRFELSQEDFVSRLGRQRVWYFYPSRDGITKLDLIGEEADRLQVNYRGKEVALTKAYEDYVSSFVEAINTRSDDFQTFVYGTREERIWLESNGVE
jgi:CRISPR associated protein, Cas1 family